MERIKTSIIMEFFNTVAFLLKFDRDSRTVQIEKEIMALLCKIHDCSELCEELYEQIEKSGNIQLRTDEAVLQSLGNFDSNTAMLLKLEALQARKIDRIKMFHTLIFSNELKEAADLGDKDACKLLASLYWLGTVFPENKQVALKLWSALATNGDRESMAALVYAYREQDEAEQVRKWQNVLRILQEEIESFSPVAFLSGHTDCAADEVDFANLIMFIRQKNAMEERQYMDRPMIHYVLQSQEPFAHKMERLSTQTNYYLVMRMEDRYVGKKFGF